MRTKVWLVCLSLLLAGIALAPGVSARDLGGGAEDDCAKPTQTGFHKACGQFFVVVNLVSCIWNGHWEETSAGPVTYREYRCDGRPPS